MLPDPHRAPPDDELESRHRRVLRRQLAKTALRSALPRRLFLTRGPARTGSVCLTFDDGPDPAVTPLVLDQLDTLGVKATFFVIGHKAAMHPEILKRIAADGHAIGHHSYTHSDPAKTSARVLALEIDRTDRLLVQVTGHKSKLFRPPWGKLGGGKLLRVWRHRKCVVLWNSDPRDGKLGSTEALVAWFDSNPINAGDIVLLHDDCPHTPGALPALVASARSRGLAFGTPLDFLRREKSRPGPR
jgi:peptidoglycan/xylan/chitin deacetylase (PgdA/CDA1 family)